jgi:hypothetical protein
VQITCCRYQGRVSAALVLGGMDVTGPHLHAVSAGQFLGFVVSVISCPEFGFRTCIFQIN